MSLGFCSLWLVCIAGHLDGALACACGHQSLHGLVEICPGMWVLPHLVHVCLLQQPYAQVTLLVSGPSHVTASYEAVTAKSSYLCYLHS